MGLAQRWRSDEWRFANYFAWLAWAGVFLLGAAQVAQIVLLGNLWFCEDGSSSNYGEMGFSYFPPGQTCEWTVATNGFDRASGPSLFLTVVLAAVLAGGLAIVLLWRRGRTAVAAQSSLDQR